MRNRVLRLSLLLFSSFIIMSSTATAFAQYNKGKMHKMSRVYNMGNIDFELDVVARLYNNGSFRDIESIHSSRLKSNFVNSIDGVEIENSLLDVWPVEDKFPAKTLLYGYSGTLLVDLSKVDIDEFNDKVGDDKLKIDKDEANSNLAMGNIYYRIVFDANGSFDLY